MQVLSLCPLASCHLSPPLPWCPPEGTYIVRVSVKFNSSYNTSSCNGVRERSVMLTTHRPSPWGCTLILSCCLRSFPSFCSCFQFVWASVFSAAEQLSRITFQLSVVESSISILDWRELILCSHLVLWVSWICMHVDRKVLLSCFAIL